DRMLSTDAYGLFVSGADGEDVTPLTEGKGLDVFPAWSPEGSHVAYMSDSGGRRGDLEVWTIAADGSDATKLTDRATEYSGTGTGPSWSPDGQTLLVLDEDFVRA